MKKKKPFYTKKGTTNIPQKEIERLQKIIIEEILRNTEGYEKTQEGKISYDGKQYSIKIPKKIAELLSLDPKKDSIQFNIKIPALREDKKPELTIVLKKT